MYFVFNYLYLFHNQKLGTMREYQAESGVYHVHTGGTECEPFSTASFNCQNALWVLLFMLVCCTIKTVAVMWEVKTEGDTAQVWPDAAAAALQYCGSQHH